MPVYLRKYVTLGPFRFNLSKSGIGVSAGVRGLRLGAGPRGHYVHAGRGGLYYKRSLTSANPPQPGTSRPEPIPAAEGATPTVGPMIEIDSAATTQLTDSSAADLLREINEKRKKVSLLPFAILLAVIALITLLLLSAPTWTLVPWATLSTLAVIGSGYRDQIGKSVVILYDLDPAVEQAYGNVRDAITAISSCARTWHVPATGDVKDRKYHAGASSVVSRQSISIKFGQPPAIKTNLDTPLIPAGRQTLVFTPERLLIFDKREVGAVPYADLDIGVDTTRFVEDESVPSDAQVVGRTWRYVNKKGGPDRRFKDNRELPIALYEELHLTSKSGLNEMFQISKLGASAPFSEQVKALAMLLGQPPSMGEGKAG